MVDSLYMKQYTSHSIASNLKIDRLYKFDK